MTSAITHTFESDLSKALYLDDHLLVVVGAKTISPVEGEKRDVCLWVDYQSSTPLVGDNGKPLSSFKDCMLDKVMMEYNVGADKVDKFQVYLTTQEVGKIVVASEVKVEASCSLLQGLNAMAKRGSLTYPFSLNFFRGKFGRKPAFASIHQGDPDTVLDPEFERNASLPELRSPDVFDKHRELISNKRELRAYNIELARDIYRALRKSTATVAATTVEVAAE